jgi:Skp family chaperone for outer membrane proteins
VAEFDPFAFLGWFVPMVLSTAFGAFVYMTRSSWSRGNKEAKTEGTAELNQTMVTNAIREIEFIKTDLKNLVNELQTQKINSTRVEERIKYMADTLELIRSDIKNMTSKIDDAANWQSDRDRSDWRKEQQQRERDQQQQQQQQRQRQRDQDEKQNNNNNNSRRY